MITRRAVIRTLRIVLLATLAGAILDLPLPLPSPPVLRCYVLDLSGSLFWGRITSPADVILALDEDARRGPASDRFALVGFAGSPALLFPPGPREAFRDFLDRDLRARLSGLGRPAPEAAPLDAGRTAIEDALDLALETGRGAPPLRVILLTDGVSTAGDARSAAARLRQAGVPLAVVPTGPYRPPDVRIVSARAPRRVAPGSNFDVELDLASTVSTSVSVEVRREGRTIARRELPLLPDTGVRVAFPGLLPSADAESLEVCIVPLRPEDDLCDANNSVRLDIARAPADARRILYVGPPAPRAVESRLQADPRNRISRAAVHDSSPPDVLVIDDTPWDNVPPSVRAALTTWVSDLGRGLLVTGGPHSLAIGGYSGQPEIEPLLPVWASPDERLGLVLVLDRSSSMGMLADGRRAKLDVARDALARVVRLLRADDRVALVAFNEAAEVVRTLQPPPSETSLLSALRGVEPRLGTQLAPPLRKALELLAESPPPAAGAPRGTGLGLRHVLVVTDGETAEPPDRLAAVGRAFREAGVSLTLVITGRSPARDALDALMPESASSRRIDLDAWDRLAFLVEEDIRRTKDLVLQGSIDAFPGAESPIRRDLPPPPPLGAVNRTTLRPEAVPIYLGPRGTPILSLRRAGAGRTAVLATSLDDPAWGAGWAAGQPHAAALIDRVIDFLDPGREEVDVDAEPVDGMLRITATLKHGDAPPGSWPVVAEVRRPDGSAVTVPLVHSAARRFEGRLAAERPGRYAIRVASRQETPDAAAAGLGTAVYNVPYAAEWRRLGRDHAALGALAESGGGRMADSPARLEALRPGGLGLLPAASVWLLSALLLLMADLLVATFWPARNSGGQPSHPTR